jgi:GT2 family glycosyltransferase
VNGAPRVSIIVLGYNGERYVENCLHSVMDQDFGESYEVLFVDNGSRDRSAEIAANIPGVQVHRLGRNYGFCLGNNKGFEVSRGELVVFLNQDTVVHRRWLRELVEAVESDESIKACHANIVHPWNAEFAGEDRDATISVTHTPELSRLGFIEYRTLPGAGEFRDTLFLSGACAILKRDVVDEIGGYVFDPGMFLYGEDLDLALRIRGAGYRVGVAGRAVVYHHHTLREDLSLATAVKVVRIIRNRLIAVWKASTWPEFAVLGAITLAGAPFNSGQFGLPLTKKVAYFFLLVPPTLIAALAFAIAAPRFAGRRLQALDRRRLAGWWLLRGMLFGLPKQTARQKVAS